jgi:hypothetical protein
MILYQNDHWRFEQCGDEPERLHVYNQHGINFPECWTLESLVTFAAAVQALQTELPNR